MIGFRNDSYGYEVLRRADREGKRIHWHAVVAEDSRCHSRNEVLGGEEVIQVIPQGKYKTLNMCDFCRRSFESCHATCTFGEALRYVPNNSYKFFKYATKNVVACDKFIEFQ